MKYLFKMIFISVLLCVVGSQNAIAAGVYTSIYQGLYVNYKDFFNPDDLIEYNYVNPGLGQYYQTSCYSGFKLFFPPGVESIAVQMIFGEKNCPSGHIIQTSPGDLSDGSEVYYGYDSDTTYKELETFIIYATNADSNQGGWVKLDFPSCPAECSSSVQVSHSYNNIDLAKYKAWHDCVTENNMWQLNGDPPSGHINLDLCGGSTEPIDDEITITSISSPYPPIYSGENIHFSAVINPYTSNLNYIWNFGDGITETSAYATADHTYEYPGIYPVTLTLSGTGQSPEPSLSTEVTVLEPVVIEPDTVSITSITPSPNPAFTSQEIQFSAVIDPSTATGLNYLWDFDSDGQVDELTDSPSASHTYDMAGEYTVTLILSGTGQEPEPSETETVVVSNYEPSVISIDAIGIWTPDPDNPKGVMFSATITPSEAAGFTYLWDFGDGTESSTDVSPWHTFASAGTYTVVLTLSGTGQTREPSKSETVSTITQADMDQAVLDAKEECRKNPELCGITLLSSAYADGYNDGFNNGYESAGEDFAVTNESQVSIPIGSDMSFGIPMIYYSYDEFMFKFSASFEYVPMSERENLMEDDIVWKLKDIDNVSSTE